jgi:putative ABC transport system ATP-binding protein
VGIARALAGRPAIVLADEPTGNLDSTTGRSILALLEELHADGATIAVVSHDQHVAARMPRQIQMLDGQIVSDTARPPAPPTTVSAPASRHPARGDSQDERTAPQ